MPKAGIGYPVAALRASLASVAEAVRKDTEAATAQRAELGRLLAAEQLRNLAERDPEVGGRITRVTQALAAEEQRVSQWQEGLAAAAREWETVLGDMGTRT